jgi:hypothetical protein
MSGAATSGITWRVASVTALNALVVSPEEVGKFAQLLTTSGTIYQAVAAGTGAACWVSSGVRARTHTYAFGDADVAVAATSVALNLGNPLPTGAFVLGVYANVTVSFTDGSTGTFSADVGVASGDDDRFTPTALDIDGGVAELTQSVLLPASGTQLAVTISSSVNLSTATAGSFALTVIYFVPRSLAV